ncbi:MAG: HAD-IA family hydrolase [Ignavibacteria bacterium]|nr:HAD-IA family hydrolase [Ignavibacteria bacterium]
MKKVCVKNIIFDLGNTLIYYDYEYFYEGVSRLEKKLNTGKLKSFIKEKNLGNKLCKGTLQPKDFFRILKRKFDLKIGYDDFIYLYSDIFWVNTRMKNFLEKIVNIKRFKVFLLSNTDPVHMNFVNKNFPFIKIIKNKVLSYKVGLLKPQKKIFEYIVKKYNLNKNETVLIDDLPVNIKVAVKYGLHGIKYTTHKKFLSEFTRIARK